MISAGQLSWQTTSYTSNGESCVEVAPTVEGVLVRDTKDHGTGPVLSFTRDEWAAFLVHPTVVVADLLTIHDGVVVKTCIHLRGLHFTAAEWNAFLAGVRNGELVFTGHEQRPG